MVVQGFDRTQPTIRDAYDISPTAVRYHSWCPPANPFLAVATAIPELLDPIRQHTCRVERGVFHSAGNWNQLLILVRSRVCFPVLCAEEELCVVEQVQLCD